MKIIAIDPGNTHSAYCIYDTQLETPIVSADKVINNDILTMIHDEDPEHFAGYFLACEMIASYGMPVGQTVFDTCVWVGRYVQIFNQFNPMHMIHLVYRKDVKMTLCGSMKAKDANIRQALVDIFGDKGTKKNPGGLYGFHSDMYAALAVAVTFAKTYKPRPIIRRAV